MPLLATDHGYDDDRRRRWGKSAKIFARDAVDMYICFGPPGPPPFSLHLLEGGFLLKSRRRVCRRHFLSLSPETKRTKNKEVPPQNKKGAGARAPQKTLLAAYHLHFPFRLSYLPTFFTRVFFGASLYFQHFARFLKEKTGIRNPSPDHHDPAEASGAKTSSSGGAILRFAGPP